MTEENRLTMFRMLLFAAVIYNFSFWISSFKINLTFKNMHGLFREAFSHVATKYLSYTRIFLFKSMLNEARIIPTLQIVQLLYPVGPIPVWCYSIPVPCLDYCGIWGNQDTWAWAVLTQEAKVPLAKTLDLDWGWIGHMEVKTEQALGFSSVWILLSHYKGLVPA